MLEITWGFKILTLKHFNTIQFFEYVKYLKFSLSLTVFLC